jgi:hypothetical protein
MSRKMQFIKKISNMTGIVMIMLGTIPTPVFAEISNTAVLEEVGATDVVFATSFSALLGETGDQPVEPTEDPAEAPVEVELSPTPSLETFTDDGDICPADGCEAGQDPSMQPKVEESLAIEVAAIAESDLVLLDENDQPVPLASNQAVEIIKSADPYFTSGGLKYCYVHIGETCSVDCADRCYASATPIQNAINGAATLFPDDGKIYVEPGIYEENITINVNGLTLYGNPGDLLLAGAGLNAPILEGGLIGGTGVHITGTNVTLIGFLIHGYDIGVLVDAASGNISVNVLNNTIEENGVGIFNTGSTGKPHLETHYNSFRDNGFAIDNNSTEASNVNVQYIEAQGNDWGCPEGPVVFDPQGGVYYYYWATKEKFTYNPNPDCALLTGVPSLWDHQMRGGSDIATRGYWSPFKININSLVVAEPYCGDGIVNNNEECDGGDHCLADCTWDEWCGDGIVNGVEECDGGDYCLADCTWGEWCGDGIVNGNEECDGGDYCLADCTWGEWCGDGIVNGVEECDGGDYCLADCTWDEWCGDGIVNGEEECDGGDHCLADCTWEEWCGDGIVNGDEQCEPGVGGGACTDNCVIPVVNLNLTSMCWENETTHMFRVTNPNSFDVAYTIHGAGSGGGIATPGVSYFYVTGTYGSATTTIIKWYDHDGIQKQNTKAANQTFCTPDVCVNIDGYQKELPVGYTDMGDSVCEYLGCTNPDAYNFEKLATLDDGSCEWCGDLKLNGREICDGEDYCNDECAYKEFADLTLDPSCVGVGTLGWSVVNPNAFSVPNVQVVVDGVLKFDGTFPANTKISMGTTPDGPAVHTMVAVWPNGGFGTFTSTEVCEPDFVPLALAIPVTGETFIIPVTGADILGAIAQQRQLLLTGGAALVGISLVLGRRKKDN